MATNRAKIKLLVEFHSSNSRHGKTQTSLHCSSNLTSWFYLIPSLEPTLKRGGERGWFPERFSHDGSSWNNFAVPNEAEPSTTL